VILSAAKLSTVFLILVSSADISSAAVVQVPFMTLDKGSRSGIRERKRVVVKTEREWEKLKRSHQASGSRTQIPSVDFEQEMVAAVFAGEKRTGGYGIEITKIEEDAQDRRLTVFFRENRPPPNAMLTQALTQPFHVVKLKKTTLKVVFSADR
jgi:hypothetical protein